MTLFFYIFLGCRVVKLQNIYLFFFPTFTDRLTIDIAVRDIMAFAVHVNMNNCTGCNNCVVACPVNALELNTVDPVTTDKIYVVVNGRAKSLDVDSELCAGCGICIEACPYDVITLKGRWEQLRNEERFTHPLMYGLEDIRDYEEESEALAERQAKLKKFPEFWELRKEFAKSGAQE